MSEEYPEFVNANVALHAITAENNGTKNTVIDRILARDPFSKSDTLPFPIHIDPEHKLLATSTEDFYVKDPDFSAEAFGSAFAGVKYEMVQPALVVVDKSGVVVRKWSWRSIEPKPETMETGQAVTDSNGVATKLVLLRPDCLDILPSIKEGRVVKTAPAMPLGQLVKQVIKLKVGSNCGECGGLCAVQ